MSEFYMIKAIVQVVAIQSWSNRRPIVVQSWSNRGPIVVQSWSNRGPIVILFDDVARHTQGKGSEVTVITPFEAPLHLTPEGVDKLLEPLDRSCLTGSKSARPTTLVQSWSKSSPIDSPSCP